MELSHSNVVRRIFLADSKECSSYRTQGMESCSRTRGRLYNCHETLRNYPPDCTCTPIRVAAAADSFLIRSILETF